MDRKSLLKHFSAKKEQDLPFIIERQSRALGAEPPSRAQLDGMSKDSLVRMAVENAIRLPENEQ